MSLDFEITSGKVPMAVRCVLYGPEGVGKTTFASQWPDPVFIDVEGGSYQYDVQRLPQPRDWNMLLAELDTIAANGNELGTIVIDTADAAEEMCVTHVLKSTTNPLWKTGLSKLGGVMCTRNSARS